MHGAKRFFKRQLSLSYSKISSHFMDPKNKLIPSPQNSAPGPYLQSYKFVNNVTRRYRIKAIIMVQLDKWKIVISFTLCYILSLVQCCY